MTIQYWSTIENILYQHFSFFIFPVYQKIQPFNLKFIIKEIIPRILIGDDDCPQLWCTKGREGQHKSFENLKYLAHYLQHVEVLLSGAGNTWEGYRLCWSAASAPTLLGTPPLQSWGLERWKYLVIYTTSPVIIIIMVLFYLFIQYYAVLKDISIR